MSARYIVAGTDTDIGKTVFSAMLVQALNGFYYKPIQCGLEGETDTQRVRCLTGLGEDHFVPEAYCLHTPVSPHLSAEIDGVDIDIARLRPPNVDKTLIVEMVGGLLVPLSRQTLFIDVLASWDAHVILCARTRLGTINHSLLSIEALKQRGLSIHGIVFIGDENKDTERTLVEMGEVARLGRLPTLPSLNRKTLREAFKQNFRHDDFTDDQ